MVDIAVIFGAERERATKELKDSLEFEMKLANVIDHLKKKIFAIKDAFGGFRSHFQAKNVVTPLLFTIP